MTSSVCIREQDGEPTPWIRLNIDSVRYLSKPNGAEIGAIVNRLKRPGGVVEIDDISELTQAICQGRTITAGELAGTNENGWRSQRLFVLDVDNEAKTMPLLTPEDVRKTFETNGFPLTFAYWTFSNTPEHPKFRIATLCGETVTSADEARKIILGIMSLFPTTQEKDPKNGRPRTVSQIDLACKNLDRMFLGTNQGLVKGLGCADTFSKSMALALFSRIEEKSLLPPEKERKRRLVPGEFDLASAIEDFDLLKYIITTTDSRPARVKSGSVMLNPCPLCGHKDDFWINTEKNIYKCFSASGGSGGNIITYIKEKHGLDIKMAREMFKYELCGINKNLERKAWRNRKIAHLSTSDRAGKQKNDKAELHNITPVNESQEVIINFPESPFRLLDLQQVEYDPDYVDVFYTTEEKEKKMCRKSDYLKMENPGKYRYEEARPVMENLKLLLAHYDFELRFNMLKNRTEVYRSGELQDRLEYQISYLVDRCKIHRYKAPQIILEGQFTTIARENKYNPISEYLKSCHVHYNGNCDYVQELCDTIDSVIDPLKKRMYIERFLLQMVWVACGDENDTKHHCEFVLTLQGKQGQGKTSWFRNLLPEHLRSEYFLDSRNMDLSKKDDILEQGTVWLCEIGEIAATFRKTDQEALKAYITSAIDKVRPPYGKESLEKKRRMCLCATTNDQEFLRDRTGDRRYAVIPCSGINQFHNVDLTGIWGQVYNEYIKGNDHYYFTESEISELFIDNSLYRVKSDLELTLVEVFDLFPDDSGLSWTDDQKWLRSRDILSRLKREGLDTKNATLRSITSTLKEVGCKWRTHKDITEFFITPL